MSDPSSAVPPQLLRHIHLVCNYKYPVMPQPDIQLMAKYLLDAPKIVSGVSTMTWMAFLEPPRDGTLMLVWQSPRTPQFATDGYLWVDEERAFSQPMKGFTMEMYVRQRGFRPRFESSTMHARRRYRLVPSSEPGHVSPPVDPCLWLIHYYRQPDLEHQIPAQNLRPSVHDQQMMGERAMLQQQGQLLQLQHKEFVLRDRENWPTVNLPGNSAPSYPKQAMGYPGNVMAHMSRSQQSAYMHNPQAAMASGAMGPVSKRPRHGSLSHGHISSTAIPMLGVGSETTYDDEEALPGSDYMDLLTPREISAQRYKQHHEWLEEVLSSPYDTNQVVPGELGLGRKGELESLTKDFFNAHTATNTGVERTLSENVTTEDYEAKRAIAEDLPTARVGRMSAEKAEDFIKRAAQRMEAVRAEMELLRSRHSKRMDKVNKGRDWAEIDRSLREATLDLSNGQTLRTGIPDDGKTDAAVEVAERKMRSKIMPVKVVECSEEGGLEERLPKDVGKDPDAEMTGSINHANDPQDSGISESQSQASATPPKPASVNDEPQASGMGNKSRETSLTHDAEATIEGGNNASEDWVMVDNEAEQNVSEPTAHDEEQTAFDSFTNDSTLDIGEKPDDDVDPPESAHITNSGLTFEDNDFSNSIDFGDLDAAGDMMSYAQEIETMGAKDQQELNMGEQPSIQHSPDPTAPAPEPTGEQLEDAP